MSLPVPENKKGIQRLLGLVNYVGQLEAQVHMVYKNAQATSAKMKEIQDETAKDSCLMRIARNVTE